MERKIINGLPQYPQSKVYTPLKASFPNIIQRIQALQKEKTPSNKQSYISTFKDMSWSIGNYCNAHWPQEVQEIVARLKVQIESFENQLIKLASQKKGSFFVCGSDKEKPVNLEPTYQRILSYQNIFPVIGIYQNKKIKEDLVYNVLQMVEKNQGFEKNMSQHSEKSSQKEIVRQQPKEQKKGQCQYCELMKAVSVCPNGFIAKKLLRELPDVEWIAGILHEQGKIVDKNLQKAVEYYEKGKKKKNPEALYRLGLINERGDYGKPLQYLKLWEQAANMGHLESMTDLGYLYENGLQNEETGLSVLNPSSQKALSYYSRAVEQNFPRALNNLASFYYNDPKYKNSKKCLQYFERAADAEYVKSLYNLGIIYFQGDLGIQDEEKYKQLIKRSAEKGDVQGKQQHVQIMLNEASSRNCSEEDLAQINLYCRQIIAEEQDNPYAYYYLGIMYESGYGVPEEPNTAFLYYSKSIRYSCPEAEIKMGFCYKNGFGIDQDSKKAIKHFKNAAQTLPQALIYIGQMYEKGYPDLKQNFEQAFNHYYDACNHQIPEAYTHVGYMYQNGRHVRKDEKKAEQYFGKGKNLIKRPSHKLGSSSQLIQSSYFRNKK